MNKNKVLVITCFLLVVLAIVLIVFGVKKYKDNNNNTPIEKGVINTNQGIDTNKLGETHLVKGTENVVADDMQIIKEDNQNTKVHLQIKNEGDTDINSSAYHITIKDRGGKVLLSAVAVLDEIKANESAPIQMATLDDISGAYEYIIEKQ